MWETPFDPIMLDGNVLILCANEELALELMDVLGEYGVKWDLDTVVVTRDKAYWPNLYEPTCYRVRNKGLGYGGMSFYDRNKEAYEHYVRCTFYGVDTHDFSAATDDELNAFLGI